MGMLTKIRTMRDVVFSSPINIVGYMQQYPWLMLWEKGSKRMYFNQQYPWTSEPRATCGKSRDIKRSSTATDLLSITGKCLSLDVDGGGISLILWAALYLGVYRGGTISWRPVVASHNKGTPAKEIYNTRESFQYPGNIFCLSYLT